ncbi:hypothetical protein [Pollutibacter soli]|uniref:hypothetical protein n=1 Tax=Pollutibacter soli TaxID=3034157 RepID=UPI0030133250
MEKDFKKEVGLKLYWIGDGRHFKKSLLQGAFYFLPHFFPKLAQPLGKPSTQGLVGSAKADNGLQSDTNI